MLQEKYMEHTKEGYQCSYKHDREATVVSLIMVPISNALEQYTQRATNSLTLPPPYIATRLIDGVLAAHQTIEA